MRSLERTLSAIAFTLLGAAALGTSPADASIITETYTGIVTAYAGPPGGLSVGDTISGSVSYNESLLTPSNGFTYTADGIGNTFMFSYDGFTVTSGDAGLWFTSTHFVPAPKYFLDLNSGSGDDAFGAGEFFFSNTSFQVSSSTPAVPLPAGLPMFVCALLGMFGAVQVIRQRYQRA